MATAPAPAPTLSPEAPALPAPPQKSRAHTEREANLAAQRQVTQRHLDGRRARQGAHVAALEAALAAAVARSQPVRAMTELTRQLAEARRAVAALRPAMAPSPA
jgi:hypothetical protein